VLSGNEALNTVAIWPGEHNATGESIAWLLDHNIKLTGCGPNDTSLSLTPESDAQAHLELGRGTNGAGAASANISDLTLIATDGSMPLIQVNDGDGITMSRLLLQGNGLAPLLVIEQSTAVVLQESSLKNGAPAIWIKDSDVSLETVDIADSTLVGIWTDGPIHGVTMNGVTITDTSPYAGFSSGVGGWGMALRGGTVTMQDVLVQNTVGFGIVAEVDALDMTGVTVQNISHNAQDLFGRGIHLVDITGEGSIATLTDITIQNVSDTALFIRNVAHTAVDNLTISDVGDAALPTAYGASSTGDGIVISGRDRDDPHTLRDAVATTLEFAGNVRIDSISRAALIVDNATLIADADQLTSSDEADSSPLVVTQANSDVSGSITYTDRDSHEPSDGGPSDSLALCLNFLHPNLDGVDLSSVSDTISCD
jgi:hypothetical protein